MAFSILDSAARNAWREATNQQAQLEALADAWPGAVSLRYYSAGGTLLRTVTHAGWIVEPATTPRSLRLDAFSAETHFANGTAAYAIAAVPSGADILRCDVSLSGPITDPGGRVRLDLAVGLHIYATASLPVDAVPAWAASLTPDTWTQLADTDFVTWANGVGGIPQGAGYAYRGTDPIPNIVDSYCDGAVSPSAEVDYYYGGGHGDGTCNAVAKFDKRTLEWSLVGDPAPSSTYLPDYPSPSPMFYPSGRPAEGWFLPASILTDAADAAYIAPVLSRVSTHMYGAAVCTGDDVHYLYLTYGKFNTLTGEWSGRGIDLGAQLQAIFSNYNSAPLQIRTMAVYDPVTRLIFVTFIPGTDGGGWRDGIIVFDPELELVISVNEGGSTFGITKDFCDLKIVGRKLYVFTNIGTDPGPFTMNQGYICDLDDLATKAGRNALSSPTTKAFTITGDTAGGIYSSTTDKDAIPSFFDGTYIWRWNYGANLNKMYRVNLTPVSGAGTPADPYVLTQTERVISGSVGGPSGAEVKYVYSRFSFYQAAGVAMVLPRASSDWLALKLS